MVIIRFRMMASKYSWLVVVIVIVVILASFICNVNSLDDNEERIHPYLPSPLSSREIGVEANSDYWHNSAQATLLSKLNKKINTNKAKNIIIFIGDGMSLHTVAAARSYIGDESTQISFEKFPSLGISKTYCVDKQVPDSACTATAYLSGVKTNYRTIGVNARVEQSNCEQGLDESTYTPSIAKWAQDAGKDAGLVTTSRVTHASPAGVYTHIAHRDWENDAKVREAGCDSRTIDIAQQLVDWEVGRNLKVVLGGGRAEFLDATMKDEEGAVGWRGDGKNLIEKWLSNHQSNGNATYVWNRSNLLAVNPDNTEYLLGLFNQNHCSFHGDLKRTGRDKIEPSLTEMTEVAIKMLKKSDKGFFLFVEGARIDMAHHDTKTRKALEDTEEMARAVQKARDMTSEKDTLIVVTSDHAHTMTINGYGTRGSNILGLSGSEGSDKLPYTAVSYANGPGFWNTYLKAGGGRRNISSDDFSDADYEYPATAPLSSETHGGDDVGVFASGPYAHLFSGNYEQNVIPVLMAYAAEIGPYTDRSNASGPKCMLSYSVFALMVLVIKIFY